MVRKSSTGHCLTLFGLASVKQHNDMYVPPSLLHTSTRREETAAQIVIELVDSSLPVEIFTVQWRHPSAVSGVLLPRTSVHAINIRLRTCKFIKGIKDKKMQVR